MMKKPRINPSARRAEGFILCYIGISSSVPAGTSSACRSFAAVTVSGAVRQAFAISQTCSGCSVRRRMTPGRRASSGSGSVVPPHTALSACRAVLASVTCTGQRSVTPSAPAAQNSSPGVISVTRQSACGASAVSSSTFVRSVWPCSFPDGSVKRTFGGKRQLDFCHAVLLPPHRLPCQYPAVCYGGGGFPPGRLRRLAERLDIEDALHLPRLPLRLQLGIEAVGILDQLYRLLAADRALRQNARAQQQAAAVELAVWLRLGRGQGEKYRQVSLIQVLLQLRKLRERKLRLLPLQAAVRGLIEDMDRQPPLEHRLVPDRSSAQPYPAHRRI